MTTPKDALGLGLFQLTTVPTLDSVIGSALVMLTINLVQKQSMHVPTTADIPSALMVDRCYGGAQNDTE